MRSISILLIFFLVACGGGNDSSLHQAGRGEERTPIALVRVATPTPIDLGIRDTSRTAGAVLSAAPSPVPAGSGTGSTLISWAVPGDTVGQVWVSVDGKDETIFAEGQRGTKPAPFIVVGTVYTFTLYAGKKHQGPPLRTIDVRRLPR